MNNLVDLVAIALGDPVNHNAALAIYSVKTASMSVIGYVHTNDDLAKGFYVLAFGFGVSAASISTNAVLCKCADLDYHAILLEGAAEMLYRAGEKARKIAEAKSKALFEARQISEMNSTALAVKRRFPIFSSNPGNIAFVPACPDYARIIGNNLIFIFKMSGSVRLTYTVYKKTKKLLSDRRRQKRSKLLKKRISLFIVCAILTIKKKQLTKVKSNFSKSPLFSAV